MPTPYLGACPRSPGRQGRRGLRLALVTLLAPLLLVGPALLPGRRLLPQLPVGFEPLASERPEAAAVAWRGANLVTSDRLFPVDGQAAPLVRADHVARAVPVPAGTSTVRTRYAPRSLGLGALVSALALLAAALLDRRARF